MPNQCYGCKKPIDPLFDNATTDSLGHHWHTNCRVALAQKPTRPRTVGAFLVWLVWPWGYVGRRYGVRPSTAHQIGVAVTIGVLGTLVLLFGASSADARERRPALLPLTASAPADARQRLSKREARAEGLRFVTPIVAMLDVEHAVVPRMDAPQRCIRRTRVTVTCRFTANLVDGRTIRSRVRVHRQRDGLLGFYMPLDVLAEGIPSTPIVVVPA